MIRRADDDKLSGAFDQVKSPPFHFRNHRIASNLTLDIADGPPDDTAATGRLCAEQLVKEGGVATHKPGIAKLNLLHPVSFAAKWLIAVYHPSSVMILSSATPISLRASRTLSTIGPGPQI